MNIEELRSGNWVALKQSPDYQTRVRVGDIRFSSEFDPMRIDGKFLTNFRHEELRGNDVYYKERDGKVISLTHKGVTWTLVVRTERSKFEGIVEYLHEVQNILADCGIYQLI